MDRPMRWLMMAFSLTPFYFLGALYVFAGAAWVRLGHFPRPSRDDPKYLGLDVFYESVQWAGQLMLYSVSSWCVLLLVALIIRSPWKRSLLVYAIGWALVWIQIIFDPFHVLYWYWD